MSRFSRLFEAQFRKAQNEGQLDDLEGAGKPLPIREGEAYQDAGLEVGLRAMAQAGVVPEEIQYKQKLEEARAAYAQAKTEEEKQGVMSEISDLTMKYEMAREARKSFFK